MNDMVEFPREDIAYFLEPFVAAGLLDEEERTARAEDDQRHPESYLRRELFRYGHVLQQRAATDIVETFPDAALPSARHPMLAARRAALLRRAEEDIDAALLAAVDYAVAVRAHLVAEGLLDAQRLPERDPIRTRIDMQHVDYAMASAPIPPGRYAWEQELQSLHAELAVHRDRVRERIAETKDLLAGVPQCVRPSLFTDAELEELVSKRTDAARRDALLARLSAAERLPAVHDTLAPDGDDALDRALQFVHRRVFTLAPARRFLWRPEDDRGFEGRRRQERFSRSYDAVLLDVDGTIIDAYDDRSSPIARQLHLLAEAGIPVAVATGRDAAGVATLLGAASRSPGLRIYGRNGTDVLVSDGTSWVQDRGIVEQEALDALRPAFLRLTEELRRACDAVPALRAVTTRIKTYEDSCTASLNTCYRAFSRDGDVAGKSLLRVEALLYTAGLRIPAGFDVQSGSDGLQIRPSMLGKLASQREFRTKSESFSMLCIADQGELHRSLVRADGSEIRCAPGGDGELLHMTAGFSVGAVAPFTSFGTREDGSDVAAAPCSGTRGTAAVLESVRFRMSEAAWRRYVDAFPSAAEIPEDTPQHYGERPLTEAERGLLRM